MPRRTDVRRTASARVAFTAAAALLTAAGRICLVLRGPSTARPFFRRALEKLVAAAKAAHDGKKDGELAAIKYR